MAATAPGRDSRLQRGGAFGRRGRRATSVGWTGELSGGRVGVTDKRMRSRTGNARAPATPQKKTAKTL